MISQKAKYAFKALVYLAQRPRGELALVTDIAAGANVPRKFLEQILIDLKNHSFIASRRGRAGGYMLLRDPASITIGGVLRAIDGPMAPLGCLSRTAYRPCADCDEATCPVRGVFGDIFAATLLMMEGTTLADAIRREPAAANPLLAAALA